MSTPSIRKPLGVLFILAIVVMWAAVVISASPWIGRAWWPVQTVVYLVAGIVWILPLKPVLRWMER
ncbi:DUF2842 domain-containing protein [Sphingomonas sp. SUN039]|uniref:DUF2842 domain-containing protein n=1 Tax=Sphingomonas sp. SUN039 TaxID=2937787 RepID=UPI0021646D72|nr:DUF2842 domain-containing protein [Sphingomonas sp. SUN039]UVO53147.1 DUF2842 domain-containing protein [Sphingomonas sp. SUN039]